MEAVTTKDNFVIGAFYELPDGRIVRTTGWHGRDNTISFYTDSPGGRKAGVCLFKTCENWKRRTDLRDFPNASDPRLPYVFDLWWDIKYMSDLRRHLLYDDDSELRELMQKHNITI